MTTARRLLKGGKEHGRLDRRELGVEDTHTRILLSAVARLHEPQDSTRSSCQLISPLI